MLKVYANLFSSNEEDFKAVADVLERNGFTIAYQDKSTGIVIKEVNSVDSGNQNS